MIWNRRLHALIPRNPIVERDLRRQQQTTSSLRGFIESFGIVAIAFSFLIAMLLCVVYTSAHDSDYVAPIELLAWAFHAIAVLRLLAAGVFSFTSDGYLPYSDDLKLTPLSNWQLLAGKWWSAMHQVRAWMLALGIVQLGIVLSTGFASLMTVDWSGSCGSPCVVTIHGLFYISLFSPSRLLIIATATISISLLETAACTAIGMSVTILTRSRFSLIFAAVLRFAPTVIFSFFPRYYWELTNSLLVRYFQYTWFSFADGGTGAILQMANPIYVNSSYERSLRGLGAIGNMWLVYISLSLLAAWLVIRQLRKA